MQCIIAEKVAGPEVALHIAHTVRELRMSRKYAQVIKPQGLFQVIYLLQQGLTTFSSTTVCANQWSNTYAWEQYFIFKPQR